MIIKNISELKEVLGDFDAISPTEQNKKYLVIQSRIGEWRNTLSSSLEDVGDSWIHVALQIQHDEPRLDTILFVCHTNEINDWFLDILTNYLYNKTQSTPLLEALDEKWEINHAAYPLLFMISTRLDPDASYTTICYQTIAPAYREKGFMKKISLNLIVNIMREFGEDHMVDSFTVHKASYLFFNPSDKKFQHFYPGDFQNLSCITLLRAHHVLVKEPVLTDTARDGWMSQALLRPPVGNIMSYSQNQDLLELQTADQINSAAAEFKSCINRIN